MRLDKYLKVSRIIKRRTVASDACTASRVTVNGKEVKPAHKVKIGDIIEVRFGESTFRVEVVSLAEHVGKGEAETLYRVL